MLCFFFELSILKNVLKIVIYRSRPVTPIGGAKSTLSRSGSTTNRSTPPLPATSNAYATAPASVHSVFASEFFNNVSRGYDILFNIFQYLKVQVGQCIQLRTLYQPNFCNQINMLFSPLHYLRRNFCVHQVCAVCGVTWQITTFCGKQFE